MANYQVLSPDGFPIEREKNYKSINTAKKAVNKWKFNYLTQGYYSSQKYGKIDWRILPDYCEIIKLQN